MASVRVRKETGLLFFDFVYEGKRCREQTALPDTPANRRKAKKLLERIEAEITLGSFEYGRYFPNSPRAAEFSHREPEAPGTDSPRFREFAQTWLAEMKPQWRATHYESVCTSLNKYLLPAFGEQEVATITKPDILEFRAALVEVKKPNGDNLSPDRVNHIMTPLRMILNEAANRYGFASPYHGIKSLKVPKTDVQPFSLQEVRAIIENVRPDFRNYYTVRFFTGMRTSEIHGLQWQYVDFDRRQILVQQALVRMELVDTKTSGSFRAIDMSNLVYEALRDQYRATGQFDYVFCNASGKPLDQNNVCKRVWHPLLKRLGLRKRRPYQTRHTAATLWLASGESPEWIARQMGHTTTEMLFRVYSRYVPNLTRRDGSAFERLLAANFDGVMNGQEKESHDQ
jgi:integrase